MCKEQWCNGTDREKTGVLEVKHVAVPLCPPQISHRLASDRTQNDRTLRNPNPRFCLHRTLKLHQYPSPVESSPHPFKLPSTFPVVIMLYSAHARPETVLHLPLTLWFVMLIIHADGLFTMRYELALHITMVRFCNTAGLRRLGTVFKLIWGFGGLNLVLVYLTRWPWSWTFTV